MSREVRKTLILGASGFIGSALKNEFQPVQERDVMSIDKNEVDLCTKDSPHLLDQIIAKNKPSQVIILAATTRQESNSEETFAKNNDITQNISRAIQNFEGKIIYLSSCAVYGEKNQQSNVVETEEPNPTSLYGEHKLISEAIYTSIIKPENLIIIRPPLVYSERQENGYHPGGFLRSANTKCFINLWGDGSELREFVHVNDAAKAISDISNSDFHGVINLAMGKSFSYQEIAKDIQKRTNCQIINHKRTRLPLVDHTYDNGKLKGLINIEKFITPYDSIAHYFDRL